MTSGEHTQQAEDEVADRDELYRRLAPGAIRDDRTVSRIAYMGNGKPDVEISVDLARLTTPERTLAPVAGRGFGVGILSAAYPRFLGFTVRRDPLPENPAHTLIADQNDRQKCCLLADNTRISVRPVAPEM